MRAADALCVERLQFDYTDQSYTILTSITKAILIWGHGGEMEKERGRNVKEKKKRCAEEESLQESGRGRFIQQIQKTELFIFVHE